MTPDKVEAALGVLESARKVLCSQDLREVLMNVQNNINSPACAGMANAALVRMDRLPDLRGALSVLTEALAERERDAARYRWLRESSGLVAGMSSRIGLALGSWTKDDASKNELDAAVDAAMKETP